MIAECTFLLQIRNKLCSFGFISFLKVGGVVIVSYYDELEIKNNATEDEIKRAYRHLAKMYHPDRHPNDASKNERFIRIAKAYEVLKDVKTRADYDAILAKKKVNQASIKQKEAAFTYPNSDFEQFFGFTQNGDKIKKELKKVENPIDVSEMFERFFRK